MSATLRSMSSTLSSDDGDDSELWRSAWGGAPATPAPAAPLSSAPPPPAAAPAVAAAAQPAAPAPAVPFAAGDAPFGPRPAPAPPVPVTSRPVSPADSARTAASNNVPPPAPIEPPLVAPIFPTFGAQPSAAAQGGLPLAGPRPLPPQQQPAQPPPQMPVVELPQVDDYPTPDSYTSYGSPASHPTPPTARSQATRPMIELPLLPALPSLPSLPSMPALNLKGIKELIPAGPAAAKLGLPDPLPWSKMPLPPVIPTILSVALGALPAILALYAGLAFDLLAKYSLGRLPVLPFNQQINYIAWALAAIGAGAAIAAGVGKWMWEQWAMDKERELRRRVVAHLLAIGSLGGWRDGSERAWRTVLSRDPPLYRKALLQYPSIIALASTCIATLAVALLRSWRLALVIFALVPLQFAVTFLLARSAAGAARTSVAALRAAASHALRTFTSLLPVFSADAQPAASARFDTLVRGASLLSERAAHRHALSRAVFGFLLIGSFALAAWYAGTLASSAQLSAGTALCVFACAAAGLSAAQGFRGRLAEIKTGRRAAAGLVALAEERIVGATGSDMGGFVPEPVPGGGGREVAFEGIALRPGLDACDLLVARGEVLGIVGGEEMRALSDILVRLADPEAGRAWVDRVELASYDVPHLRRRTVSLAAGGMPLLTGSVAEAVADGLGGGTEAPDQARVQECLAAVGMGEVVGSLPRGAGTSVWVLGEGERERIAVARALYKDPEILILDDPVPHLTAEEELELLRYVVRRPGRRPTVLLRSHRTDALRLCDAVAVFAGGRVAERGSYDALLADPSSHLSLLASRPPETPQLRRTGRLGGDKPPTPTSDWDDEESTPQDGESATPQGSEAGKGEEQMLLAPGAGAAPAQVQVRADEEVAGGPAPSFSLLDVFKLSRPEAGVLAGGTAASLFGGMVVVLFAVVLGQLLFVYTDPDPEDVTAGANFWSLIVFNVAALEGVAFYAKVLCFELAGERLTMRVRKRAFDAALAHELAWFSMQEHSPAQVMRALSAEAPKIRGAATGAWGNLVGFLSTAIGGFVWAMLCGWKLALVAWALVPAVAILGAVERYFSGGAGKVLSSGVAAADGLVAEAVDAWRTVAAYGLEDKVLARYKASLKDVSESTELGRGIAAAAHGLAQGVLYFFQALFWWYAASLLRPFEYSLLNIAIIWALAAFCGTASGQLPAVGDVLEASRRALATVALIMAPSPPQPEGRRYMGEAAAPSGSLEIADLAYTDPDTGADVLRGFALSLHPGEHVAVVGATHAERRALHALVLGLYEPSYGRIVLDGVDVRDWDGRFMRARVTALWDRDAPVFSGTAADNVAYGMPDATPESIMAAAGAAGVHDAIQAVGGYETVLGPGGKELDGESAERMALARALIRDPELLLVDDPAEPSSDPALARLLLAAADRRTVLRTTDDLPSVVGCNRIFVVRQGAVVEEGTHAELLEHHGDYFRMWNAATH